MLFFKWHSFIPFWLSASFWQYDAVWLPVVQELIHTIDRCCLLLSAARREILSVPWALLGSLENKNLQGQYSSRPFAFFCSKQETRITSATETTGHSSRNLTRAKVGNQQEFLEDFSSRSSDAAGDKKKIILRQNKVSSMMQFTQKSRGLFPFYPNGCVGKQLLLSPGMRKINATSSF